MMMDLGLFFLEIGSWVSKAEKGREERGRTDFQRNPSIKKEQSPPSLKTKPKPKVHKKQGSDTRRST